MNQRTRDSSIVGVHFAEPKGSSGVPTFADGLLITVYRRGAHLRWIFLWPLMGTVCKSLTVTLKNGLKNTSMAVICRRWITLRNGKRLNASEVGLQAFCFEVDKIRPKKAKKEEPPADDR